MREILKRGAGALLVVLAAACGDEGGVEPVPQPAVVATVSVTPATSELEVGETVSLTATARDAAGEALSGRTIAFASSAGSVATVSAAGVVTAKGAGTATITASSGGRSATASITVVEPAPPPPPVASIALDVTSITLDEDAERRLVATARDAAGQVVSGVEVAWTTSDATVATVAPDGLVRAVRMGVATVTATAQGKSVEGQVMVYGTYPYDLVMDVWGTGAGGVMRPSVHRLDLRAPEGVPHPVTIHDGASQATASPDGTRIAYTCVEPHGTAICVADRNGANVRVLTSPTTLIADQPAWSPDGARIAFRGWAPGGPPGPHNPSRIRVMNADGTGWYELTGGAGWQESPAWSPALAGGAYRIAYSERAMVDGVLTGTIRSMRDDGSDVREVTGAGLQLDDEPSWSPDGTRIAFVRTGGDDDGRIWLVNATGGGERPLMAADPDGPQRGPSWSPDGLYVAFASNHEIDATYYTWQIYTVHPDGTSLVRRTFGNVEKQNPAWMGR